jgi:predicted nucleotidyltransferase
VLASSHRYTSSMTAGPLLDRDAIARVCRAHGVSRLRMFGSATTDRFDPEHSDVDFLVEFTPGSADPFDDYFGLKEDLELLLDRDVDIVMKDALRNPHLLEQMSDNAVVIFVS